MYLLIEDSFDAWKWPELSEATFWVIWVMNLSDTYDGYKVIRLCKYFFMSYELILRVTQRLMRTAAAWSGKMHTLSCWPCVCPSHWTFLFQESLVFMSTSFTVGQNVLLKLDCKLLEQKTHTCFASVIFFLSISTVPVSFVKPADAQTLTSLLYSPPGAEISKAIVTCLHLWSLDHAGSQIILFAVLQAYFRRTVSHPDRLVVSR